MSTEKDLPHRTWSSLRDLWLEHVPPDLGPSDVDLTMLIGAVPSQMLDKQTHINEAGLREQTLRDVLFLRQKGIYCVSCARSSASSGFSTWSAPTMYDACFFFAKAFIYFLGIRDLSRDSSMYVDIFYREYRKGRNVFDGYQILKLRERLTHDMVWTLFGRQIRTLTADVGDMQSKILQLRQFDLSHFSRERNRLLYKSFSWSRESELPTSDLWQRCTYLSNAKYFEEPTYQAEFIGKYFFLAFAISNCLDFLLADLGNVAPALQDKLVDEPGPIPLPSFLFVES